MTGGIHRDVCPIGGYESLVIACDGDAVSIIRYVDGAVSRLSGLFLCIGAEIGVVGLASRKHQGKNQNNTPITASPPALFRREGAGVRKDGLY